ncbi:YheC/YheD family protein [Salipaludibacillus daqingensis]|uniref:YheC/YheD family protein n=1 Tax=Salipaludibacillus daqingensis TaxID=3041001 RepID=UPI0024771107|nr:YheC/YheD family protein [Salipaludibacillus daqingensis]
MRLWGRNKYKMYLALKRNTLLRPYLPDTVMWSKENFTKMLTKYHSIVVKPNNGKQGNSIYFVEIMEPDYCVYINKKQKTFQTQEQLYHYLKKVVGDRKFIIQREVALARIDGRPFDFRIIVQRKSKKKPWQITGILARKGGDGYKVTNRRREGTALTLDEVLKKVDMQQEMKGAVEEDIKQISLAAAETLGKCFPEQKIFGVDIGMDQQGAFYIFELNRWPLLGGFRSLKDPTQINRIMEMKGKK